MCSRRPFSVGCLSRKPAPKGVTLMSRVISFHSKVRVSRPRTRTGNCSGRRSRIRFQFRSSPMGADGRGKRSEKRRECLHEAIDFIRVFAHFGFANRPQKRLKYGYFELDVFTRFSSLQKRQTQGRYLVTKGRTARRIVSERLLDGNNF